MLKTKLLQPDSAWPDSGSARQSFCLCLLGDLIWLVPPQTSDKHLCNQFRSFAPIVVQVHINNW